MSKKVEKFRAEILQSLSGVDSIKNNDALDEIIIKIAHCGFSEIDDAKSKRQHDKEFINEIVEYEKKLMGPGGHILAM